VKQFQRVLIRTTRCGGGELTLLVLPRDHLQVIFVPLAERIVCSSAHRALEIQLALRECLSHRHLRVERGDELFMRLFQRNSRVLQLRRIVG
jgi:hypothetical protein